MLTKPLRHVKWTDPKSEFQRWSLKYLLSSFVFNFNLRRYTTVGDARVLALDMPAANGVVGPDG